MDVVKAASGSREGVPALRRKPDMRAQLPRDLFIGMDGCVYRGRKAVADADLEYERNLGVPGAYTN